MEFAIPIVKTVMDMSLTDEERARRIAFYNKKQEMVSNNQTVFDCPNCLIIFSDVIIFRMHMSMHPPALPDSLVPTSSSPSTWQCSLCKRQCSNRLDFQEHTVKHGHSLIPQGIFIPPSLPYHFGLPDLSSLCQPSDLLKELANLVKNNLAKHS